MSNKIALIFDFDDTLAPDTVSGFLQDMGVDSEYFWKSMVEPLFAEDWDPVPAYLYALIQLSQSGKYGPITRERLQDWGKRLPFYPGVEAFFPRIRQWVEKEFPHISLEFYLVSSGLSDIVMATPIAQYFNDIWASEFMYDTEGGIVFPKKVLSFTDKTKYLFHVKKGIVGPSMRGKPFEVNRKVSQPHIPFEQMIFIGDGYTDIPCFSLIRRFKGIALGVWSPEHQEKRQRAWGFLEDGRVTNLNQARYDESSDLYQVLMMVVHNLAERIALNQSIYKG